MGYVDWVAGARDFHLVAVGSRGIPAFEIGVDGSVAASYQHPTRFTSPRSSGDYCFEILSFIQHLRPCHERCLLSRQVGGEVFMKLRGIEVSETICCLLYRVRLTEITREALSVVSLIFSGIRHVGRDVHQAANHRVSPSFSDYRSPIAVCDKNARSILLREDAPRSGDIVLEGRLRLLYDAGAVAVFDENLVNTFPARAICPCTVNQNNIPNARLLALRRKGSAG